MPALARINLYPIKSLDGFAVSEARLLPAGPLEFDRRWAITDWDGNLVNGKRNPKIHLLATQFDVDQQTVTLSGRAVGRRGTQYSGSMTAQNPDPPESLSPATFSLADLAEMGEWLSEFFGIPVYVVEDAARAMPDDPDSPGPTIISTATLQEVAGWFSMDLDEVRRRFRANLEIDGVEPFWEDRLYGPTSRQEVPLHIGDVELIGTNPCQRCAVPSRHPDTGTENRAFARKFSDQRERLLPPWAPRGRFDHFYRVATNTRLAQNSRGSKLRVGDEVMICEA